MAEIKDQVVSLRLTLAQKTYLVKKASQREESLGDYLMNVVAEYDTLTERAEQLQELLQVQEANHEQQKTPVQSAVEMAQDLTSDKLAQLRREAVAEYRQQLLSGESTEEESELVAELRTRLALYETPVLDSFFEQVEGKEIDFTEQGESVTLLISDRPDVVRVMLAKFAVQPVTPEIDEQD